MKCVSVASARKSQPKESNGTLLAMTLCALVSKLDTGLLE